MLDLPIQDFPGTTRNFEIVEKSSSKASTDISSLKASITSINSQITALNSSITTLNSQLALTSTGAVPTTATRLMLSGFRSITPSTTTILISDFYLEVPTGSAVTSLSLPSATATDQYAGKVYMIRNGKTAALTLNGVPGVAKTTATSVSLGAGTTLVVLNTGSKWRSLGDFRTGNTIGGVA